MQPIDPLLNDKETAALLGCAVPTLWRWARIGKVPKPIKLGVAMSRWPQSEILQVIENAKGARQAA